MRNLFSFASFLLVWGFLAVAQLEAQVATNSSPSDQLQQLTAQLQNSPDDAALRGRIIALAQTIVPAPALPDEAERRMARGTEAFKEAKSTADYQDAVKEFKQATLAAPWSGDAYFNLGLAQDKAEDFEGSLASLKLAQLASPDSKDIKDLYYKVEFQRDKAAEQISAAATQAAQQAAEQQRIAAQQAAVYQGLDGRVWQEDKYYESVNGASERLISDRNSDVLNNVFLEIHGNKIKEYLIRNANSSFVRKYPNETNGRMEGWTTTFDSRQFNPDLQTIGQSYGGVTSCKVTISDDGESITIKASCNRSYGTVEVRDIYQRIK